MLLPKLLTRFIQLIPAPELLPPALSTGTWPGKAPPALVDFPPLTVKACFASLPPSSPIIRPRYRLPLSMDLESSSHPALAGEFGPLHVLQPQAQHSHTVIMLHGRGSTGEEFANELFESRLSDGTSLRDHFPGCRWVFPSSKKLWSSTFQEEMTTWFHTPSTDTIADQDLQGPGVRDSVLYLRRILDDEISLVSGPEKVILGGISQGGAIATWALLCHPGVCRQGLCAFIGASTWLPFAADIEAIRSIRPVDAPPQKAPGDLHKFVGELVASVRDGLNETGWYCPLLKTPVFMGHGSDDAYVDVELGREAVRTLSSVGFKVEWNEYSGAEQEGHWVKVPEEVDDIKAFLVKALSKVN